MRILIIKPSSFGDVIHALPVAHTLKKTFPECRISWVVFDIYREFLSQCPAIDRILSFPRRPGLAGLRAALDFARGPLQEQEQDLVIDLQCLLRSGLLTAAAPARRKMGLQDGREGCRLFYHDVVRWPERRLHAVDRYLKVLAHLGLRPVDVRFPLRAPSTLPSELKAFAAGSPYIVVNPFSRGAYKRWCLAGFRQVMDALPKRKFVVIGQASDAAEASTLGWGNMLNLAGKTTLSELTAVLSQAAGLLTNDSGPMHLAVALERPVLALFGPGSSPDLTGPYCRSAESVRRFAASEVEASNASPDRALVQDIADAIRKW